MVSDLPCVMVYETIFFVFVETINGELQLLQKNETRINNYVSNKDPVVHQIILKKSDRDYIHKATNIYTYWFVDCTYYGMSADFNFTFNYTDVDRTHLVEALLVADFTPLPPTTTVAPTTTTTTTTAKPTTTSTTTKPTTKPSSTTASPAPTKATTTAPSNFSVESNRVKRHNLRSSDLTSDLTQVNTTGSIMVKLNGTLVKYNGSFPMVCGGTQVSTDGKKSYGYFRKKLEVKGRYTF